MGYHNRAISLLFSILSTSTITSIGAFSIASSARINKSLVTRSLSMTSQDKSDRMFVMDDFCIRQFNNPSYTGTHVTYDIEEFEKQINDFYKSGKYPLVDGYAPFCKHLFVPNFANVDCGYLEITAESKPLIESGYEARKEGELPVLIEYVDRAKLVSLPKATFLDIILYSREQIIKENIAMGSEPPKTDAPWGIISVKGQLNDFELPMQPITMMRNALGKAEGGSGVPLDREKYMTSVAFWTKHVAIK